MINFLSRSYVFISKVRAGETDPPGEISDDRPSEVTFNSSRFQPRFDSQLYARLTDASVEPNLPIVHIFVKKELKKTVHNKLGRYVICNT